MENREMREAKGILGYAIAVICMIGVIIAAGFLRNLPLSVAFIAAFYAGLTYIGLSDRSWTWIEQPHDPLEEEP